MSTFVMTGIEKSFQNGDKTEQVLKGVDLALQAGEVTALTGASGSGKSTLLTIAAGLQSPSAGAVWFNGENMAAMTTEQVRAVRATQFGFVFQAAHLVPFLTVEEQLLFMLKTAEVEWSKKEQEEAVRELLEKVGLEHRKQAYPEQLSGGEKQRAAIARAVVHRPNVLFADEPTASLDSACSEMVMKLLHQLAKDRNMAVLTVTHDEDMLAYTDRVVHMRDGVILEQKTVFHGAR